MQDLFVCLFVCTHFSGYKLHNRVSGLKADWLPALQIFKHGNMKTSNQITNKPEVSISELSNKLISIKTSLMLFQQMETDRTLRSTV